MRQIHIAILLFLGNVSCFCQNDQNLRDVLRQQINVELLEGNSINGEFIHYTDTTLIIQIKADRQKINRADISSIWKEGRKYFEPYPYYGGLMPTAFEQKGFEYRNDMGLVNRASFPIKGNLSGSIGWVLIRRLDDNLAILNIKYSFRLDKKGNSPFAWLSIFSRFRKFVVPAINILNR